MAVKHVTTKRMPVGFISHGSPMMAVDDAAAAPWTAWGRALPTPRAVLVVSAHWETSTPTLGTVDPRPLLYDFGGFPEVLSTLQYRAPGAPSLATRLAALSGVTMTRAPERPWDHGVWVPLLRLLPRADVPVLQLSLPRALEPKALLALGRALAPLRDEGVFLLGSGGLTHNLRRLDWRGEGPKVTPWAAAFDAWAAEVLTQHDEAALAAWETRAPKATLNHPTSEHLRPLLVAAGAAARDDAVTFPVTGFQLGSLSLRSVQWG